MLGPRSGLGQHLDDVGKRLLDLGDEIVAGELLLRVPADLAGNEDLPAFRGHAVGEALGGGPVLGMKDCIDSLSDMNLSAGARLSVNRHRPYPRLQLWHHASRLAQCVPSLFDIVNS